MISPPLFPLFDVPVLNTSIPLDPEAPEFALRITMLPLVVAVPSPLCTLNAPPVHRAAARQHAQSAARPARAAANTDTHHAAAARPSQRPSPTYSAPLLPSTRCARAEHQRPLAPSAPEFALRIEITPLLVAVPSPLSRLSAPPVCTVLRPDSTLTAPPDPLVPLPTLMLTMPPRPPVATPVPRYRAPLLPLHSPCPS